MSFGKGITLLYTTKKLSSRSKAFANDKSGFIDGTCLKKDRKTSWGKEKMLVTSICSVYHGVFNSFFFVRVVGSWDLGQELMVEPNKTLSSNQATHFVHLNLDCYSYTLFFGGVVVCAGFCPIFFVLIQNE